MEFLDARQTKIAVRNLAKKSPTADLVVAFWGNGAIEELALDQRAGPTNIICNLESGATNPKVISDIMRLAKKGGPKIGVRQNDRLHSKIYLFEDAVIIGSSNASTNGLAFEGGELTHSMEANVLSHDAALIKSARDWITALASRDITSADLARARAAWNKRRSAIKLPRDNSQTVLQAMQQEPATLADLPIYLVIYCGKLSPNAAEYEASMRQAGSPNIGLFEDWDGLPERGFLLTFEVTKSGFAWDDAWERRGVDEDHTMESGATAQIVWKANDVFGKVPFRHAERKIWGQICSLAVRHANAQKEPCFWLPLTEVLATMLPQGIANDAFKEEVWKSILQLEGHLKAERGRAITLGRTRLKIKRVGEVKTVADLVAKRKASDGFKMLVDRDLRERTFEALALRFPTLFDPYVLDRAAERLTEAASL